MVGGAAMLWIESDGGIGNPVRQESGLRYRYSEALNKLEAIQCRAITG